VSLWGTQVGIKGGLSGADALQQAMIIFAVIQSVALLASPVIGILNDRINRVTALILGMGLAALGYLAFGLHDNPFGGTGIGVAVLLGFGQIAAILAGTTLVGQEADPKITGATIGVWSFCGAVGTLIGSFFGGILFDLWTPGAPFLLMGILNLLVMIAAIWVRIRFPGDGQLRSEEAGEFIAPIRDD
jgi:MFS family permease